MPHTVSSLMFMYADDAKVARVVSTISDCDRQTWIASGFYLETMVSRLECTRVHFVKISVSVSVSRPEDPGLGLGLKTACLVRTPVARLP